MLDDLIKLVIEWNKTAFPENTLSMQAMKITEEFKEAMESQDRGDFLSEFVDFFIATIGLKRFSEEKFYTSMGALFSINPFGLNKLVEEGFKKMEINKRRKWILQNGVYHHKELN